jgi:hypothetical protein
LKLEITQSSKAVVPIYHITWCYIPDDHNLKGWEFIVQYRKLGNNDRRVSILLNSGSF